ncbi:hypothetical protein RCS94_04850 [Orbaceae bacterium ac157xtp]
MKTNRKYQALLFLIIIMSLCFFCGYIIIELILSIFIYIVYGDFIFGVKNIYIACKLAPFGIPSGVGIWYLECRRLGIKIFGKNRSW